MEVLVTVSKAAKMSQDFIRRIKKLSGSQFELGNGPAGTGRINKSSQKASDKTAVDLIQDRRDCPLSAVKRSILYLQLYS